MVRRNGSVDVFKFLELQLLVVQLSFISFLAEKFIDIRELRALLNFARA